MYALLDLIVLEGIYPFLTPGVGIPIEPRTQSLLQGAMTAGCVDKSRAVQAQNQDLSLLKQVVDQLFSIVQSSENLLRSTINDRSPGDLVSACVDLAFGPRTVDPKTRQSYRVMYQRLLDMYVTSSPLSSSISQVEKVQWMEVCSAAKVF